MMKQGESLIALSFMFNSYTSTPIVFFANDTYLFEGDDLE